MDKIEKSIIYKSFAAGTLKVLSVSKDKKVEWKKVTDVTRHDVSKKAQYELCVDGGITCKATEDHSFFKDNGANIEECKTGHFSVGSGIVFVDSGSVVNKSIVSNREVPTEKFMYDLSVEDNQNFVIKKGFLAHNSFRPPSKEKFLQSQAQVFGYIWEDEELLEYLLFAVDDLNSAPPVTGVSLDDIPDRWRTAILIKAAAFACMAISMNWISDEFSVAPGERVTVRCGATEEISITFEELFDIIYGEMMDEVNRRVKEEFKESLEDISPNDPDFKIENEDIKLSNVTNELSEKIKNAFYSKSLYVRSMKDKEDKPSWNPVSNVTKHHTPFKKIYKVITKIGSVTVTEDHSLFEGVSKDPVKASALKSGDFIVGLPGSEFQPVEIISIECSEPLENTYDLTVPDAENAVLDSGLLVHNTYSISGVSLDIDKSSKYQSMKQNFESEYDKAKEGIKRSIKITKGLKQPRYGIGVSSALGPYSRPGVQSRRNFTSGTRGGWS